MVSSSSHMPSMLDQKVSYVTEAAHTVTTQTATSKEPGTVNVEPQPSKSTEDTTEHTTTDDNRKRSQLNLRRMPRDEEHTGNN